MVLICCPASLCGGPVIIRLYRKRKAARLMHRSLELKSPAEKLTSDQQPKSEAAAASGIWAIVSSVESFCNTSYAAGGHGAAACQWS